MQNNFNPLVSIVIPVYNGSNYMREAIDSALAQTYPNIEVIVVNDGSTDNTDEIAKAYGNKIRYFSKENGGVSTALNLAIENMKGEYFSWLSHDDVYLPEKIEIEINTLKNIEDKTTVINCEYENIDEYSNKLKNTYYSDKYLIEDLNKPLFSLFTACITGCGLLIHISHLKRCKNFDITQRITQDYDMWFKILREAKLCFINKVLVQIREHNVRVTNTSSKYINECELLWQRLFKTVTEKEIIDNFKTKLRFYEITATEFIKSALFPDTIQFLYQNYTTEYKTTRKTLTVVKTNYRIEKLYAYFTKQFKIKSVNTYLIFMRHILKKIIKGKD